MISKWVHQRKPTLLLVSLLALAGLCGCGRTAAPHAASSSCGAVKVQPTATAQLPSSGGVVIQGPPHVESIVATGSVAYVGSDNGSIYAFSSASCTPLWQRHLFVLQAGVYAASGGMVFVSNPLQPAPVYALSASTGKVVWQFSHPGAVGIRILVQDGLVLVSAKLADDQKVLTALRASDGQVLWQTAPSPALQLPELLGVGPGVVYIRQTMGQEWEPPTISMISALDAGSGRVLWTATLAGSDGAAASAPVESNGLLYIETNRGAVYALRTSTGVQLWHIAGPQGALAASPYTMLALVVANGVVYAGGYQGLVAIQASDGSMVWRYHTIGQSQFPSLPVLAAGVIYISTGVGEFGDVVALRASDGTVLWKRPGAASSTFGAMFCVDGLLINDGAFSVSVWRTSDGSPGWQSTYMPVGAWYTAFGASEALGTGAGVLYVGSADGVVHALRVSDGRQLWQYAFA